MTKRLYILLAVLLMAISSANAQQLWQFNQYMFNPLVVNPAYAGSRNAVDAVLLHRTQWLGFNDSGSPAANTQSFSINGPTKNRNIGLGFSVINDMIGPSASTSIHGSYAYHLQMRKGRWAMALRTGLYNYRFNWQKIDYKDQQDGYAAQGTEMYWLPTFDFGTRYYTRTFYTGLTFSHLNRPAFKLKMPQDTANYKSILAANIVFTAGKAFEINRDFIFRPSVFVKASEGQQYVVDVNASVLMKEVLWLGISVRTNLGVVAIAEYEFTDRLRAGYSYDMTLNKLWKYNSGSHEVFIGYDIALQRKRVLSPRYF